MSNLVLAKYKGIRVVKNEPKLREMQTDIVNWPADKQRSIFAHDPLAGGVFLYDDQERYPGMILEYVSGVLGEDSISSLYEPHPALASLGTLMQARKDVITEIHRQQHVFDGMLTVGEKARGRPVLIKEMCLAQLIDLLELIEHGVIPMATKVA